MMLDHILYLIQYHNLTHLALIVDNFHPIDIVHHLFRYLQIYVLQNTYFS